MTVDTSMYGDVGACTVQDAQPSKTAFINNTQQCFAVQNGLDSVLDLARATFCTVTEQVHALVEQYRQTKDLGTLKVGHTLHRSTSSTGDRPTLDR